ncbi:uncharacterized protein [Littorina saxatilis]|uniref:uncharacterized protein isoform X2 n=1 Tax=Littorina saxatilis TaxID=31220 RepID=UPI0038B61512
MAEFRSCSAIDGDALRKGLYSCLSTATYMMDEEYRESLHRHYHLLMTHIILTDDIMQRLANEKILPSTMIKDIRGGRTKEERNECLLNALRLRGNKSFKKFRELMYRTGNFFVADLLWGEGDSQGIIDEKDLAKFPGLVSCVQDNQKKKLVYYLDSKIREKALQLAWKHNPQERIDHLRSKAIDFNQEKIFRDTITSQEEKIKNLEDTLAWERVCSKRLKIEIGTLEKQIDNIKLEHRSSTETQLRFNDANITSITRYKDRLNKVRGRVLNLTEEVQVRLDPGTSTWDSSPPPPGDSEELDFRVSRLENNTRSILNKLRLTQDLLKKLQTQREDVLKLVNRRYSHEPLVSVVKDVLKHEQKHRSLVMRDILRLNDTLKHIGPGTNTSTTTPTLSTPLPDPSILDTKHFKSQLALLKAEAEHIQKRFKWKESEVITLQQEVFALKQRLGEASPFQPPNTPASNDALQTSPRSISSGTFRPRTASTSSLERSPSLQKSLLKRSQSSKTVTFHKTVLEKNSEGNWVGRTDLDKTHIDADEYLQEEVVEEEELGDAEDDSVKVPADFLQSWGEGDTTSKTQRQSQANSALYAAYATSKINHR